MAYRSSFGLGHKRSVKAQSAQGHECRIGVRLRKGKNKRWKGLTRALAMYLLVFNGGMAVGSALWGVIAARASTPLALMSAALGLILGLTTMIRYRLVTGEA